MSQTDEQIVRQYLIDGRGAKEDIVAALDRMAARTVPQFPEGWRFTSLNFVYSDGLSEVYKSTIYGDDWIDGQGPTIRASVEDAIAKIRRQKC